MLVQDMTTMHFLHPGDVTVAFSGDRLETLLGSCVSVLLVSPCFQVACMCHFVYSSYPSKIKSKDASYAGVAMARMEHLLRNAGFSARLCRAYVFGGGNMFPSNGNLVDIGSKNVEWAFNYLQHKQIPVVDFETGQNYYRKLTWVVGASNPCDHLLTVSVLSS